MSKAELSPFTPGQPVPPDLFTGRQRELDMLDAHARAAAEGRLQVAFLSGERGIGKSSIAAHVRLLSEHRYHLLTAHVFMGGASSVEEMVRRIFDKLVKVGQDTTWFEKIRSLFGKNIQTVGLLGIQLGFQPSQTDLEKLADNFDTAVHSILDKLKPDKPGLLLVVDDINGLASSARFAHWLKSFVDSAATSPEPLPLFLLLVGLEERRRELINLQPSLARLFHLVDIRPWTREETGDFFRRAFESVNIEVDADALEFMSSYAGGLPVLAHEIGDAAFRIAGEERITRSDAQRAVVSAAEVVGRKHIDVHVFAAIRSKHYRRILRKIPHLGLTFKRSDLIEHLDGSEAKVLDNFLRKMRDLGVLSPEPAEGQGWYRFTTSLHFVYFLLEALRSSLEERD